jgi:predicted NBD/HSP70 family sugar kinase
VENFVLLSVGTGVGVGVIIDGRLYRGARGGAGEVGFIPLGDGARLDGASSRGVFEELTSADGVVRSAHQLGLTGASSAKAVFEAAAAGDRVALKVVDKEGRRLAVALTAICAVLDPEMVVLAGGVGRNTEALLPSITAELARLSPLRPKVVAGELGDGAALLGALATALTHAHDVVFASRTAGARR